jgi:GntR family transcriptional regulator, transcriptional repressor for pyruvate dehydrogenase complex
MDEQYEAVRSTRLYEKIVEQIAQRILSGELKLGDGLPPERVLADQFQVSRTAVREAVKALTEKGLVEVRPGRGTFVTNGTSHAVGLSLGMLARMGLNDSTRELVEVREIFEPEIAALAALHATTDDIARLRRAVAIMDSALEDAVAFIEADLDFHQALASASKNHLIPTIINPIVGLLREQRTKIFHVQGGPERGQTHHKKILTAVIRHDITGAREAMRAHLLQVRKDSEV